MKIYVIRLQDYGGDSEVKAVDSETYEWIVGPSGQPDGASLWVDPFVPELYRAAIEAYHGGPLKITRGSWENDRALVAQAHSDYAHISRFDDNAETAIRARAQERGDEVAGTYSGSIY